MPESAISPRTDQLAVVSGLFKDARSSPGSPTGRSSRRSSRPDPLGPSISAQAGAVASASESLPRNWATVGYSDLPDPDLSDPAPTEVEESFIQNLVKTGDPELIAQREFRDMSVVDPQEARAQELEYLGDHVAASRVRNCAYPANPGSPVYSLRRWTCKRRDCPHCARTLAERNKFRVASAIRRMANPEFFLFTLPAKSIHQLRPTVRKLRRCIAACRRRKAFDHVRAGAGAIEVKVTEAGGTCLPHAHLALDVDDDFDLEAVKRTWARLTGGRGTFGPDPNRPEIERANIMNVAGYSSKSQYWCPPAGQLLPNVFDGLRRSIKGLQLLVEWGGDGQRGRNRRGSRRASGGST